MPTRIAIAFFGMIIGGVMFLVTGFTILMAISQVEEKTITARAPVAQQQEHIVLSDTNKDVRSGEVAEFDPAYLRVANFRPGENGRAGAVRDSIR